MAWGIEQSVRLITLFVFVFWQAFDVTRSKMGVHYKGAAAHYKIPLWIKARWFPYIWFFLNSCVVASSFLYMEYTLSTANDWPYTAVFVLFFANIIMAKLWTPMFFRFHWYSGALVNGFLIMGTAWAIFGIAISGINLNAGLYLAPALVWLPYPIWLTIAFIINWQFAAAKYRHLAAKGRPYGYQTLPNQ